MGQAKRRRQQLGDLYGTPEGSNRPPFDPEALRRIEQVLADGQRLLLVGSDQAQALAAAAGLPWLHRLPEGEPLPQGVAWDLQLAMEGGPVLTPDQSASMAGCVVVLGPGSSRAITGTDSPLRHHLPPDQRRRNIETLSRMVAADAVAEVEQLLASEPDWSRSYPSRGGGGTVRVSSTGGLMRVEAYQ